MTKVTIAEQNTLVAEGVDGGLRVSVTVYILGSL